MAVEYGINRIGDDHAISAIFAGDGLTSYSKVLLGRRVTNAFDLVLNVAPTVLPSTAKIRSGFALDQYDAIYATATEPAAKLYSFGIATRTDGAVYCVDTPSGGLREVYHPLIGFCLIDGRGGLYVSQSFGLPLNDAGNGAVDTSGFLAGATVSFTRATAASTRLSNGLLKTDVASGVARSWYAADGTYLGFISELDATNLSLQSEDFSNAAWTKTDTTVTANSIAAPDGATTADLLTEGAAGTADVVSAASRAITANGTASMKRFLKVGNTPWVRLSFYETAAAANMVSCWFNLSTGAVGTPANGGTATGAAGYIEQWANGWYCCTVTGDVENGATAVTEETSSADADGSMTRVNNATRYEWGAMFFDGAYPFASYIPTTTTAVTRNADRLSYTGAPNFGAQGSMYCEFTPLRLDAGTAKSSLAVSNNTSSEIARFLSVSAAPTSSQFSIIDGGVAQAAVTVVSSLAVGATAKLAGAWMTDMVNFAAGGTLGTTDTSATMPTTDRIHVGGASAGTLQPGGCVKNVNITSQIRTDLASITA